MTDYLFSVDDQYGDVYKKRFIYFTVEVYTTG